MQVLFINFLPKINEIKIREFFKVKIFFQDDDGKWIEDSEQPTKLKCDFVISAFGSGLYDAKVNR